MRKNRKDNKGRNLRVGEGQRSDGRYYYRYKNSRGVRDTIYSWKLVDTDRLPTGKKCSESLRTMIQKIQRDQEDGIDTNRAKEMTLNEFADEFFTNKFGIRESTFEVYKRFYDNYVRNDSVGRLTLSKLRYSDVKNLYVRLLHSKTSKTSDGLKPKTIELLNAMLNQVFELAVKDHIIRENPAKGVINELRKSDAWETERKSAMTIPQQSAFIDYVKNEVKFRHWLPLFTFLLGTGCRIGEAICLTWSDIDFEENMINIRHTMQRLADPETGKMVFKVSKPKTKTSVRQIPMLTDVRNALLQERKRQFAEGFCQIEVDGHKGFVFTTPKGELLMHNNVDRVLDSIVQKYNQAEKNNAEREKREPEYLPHISAHIFRHTFATRFCENESNLKVIQDIMGHSTISTTMDIYAKATADQKRASICALEGKVKIS